MNIHTFFSIPRSFVFNLKYLPLHQAIKIPILLGRRIQIKIAKNAHIAIDGPLRPGMIQLAFTNGSFEQAKGASSYLRIAKGAKLSFKGTCKIEKGFTMCVNTNASLTIGDKVHFNAFSMVNSNTNVEIGDLVQFGWHCTVIDDDGHDIINISDGRVINQPRPVSIGKGSWLGAHTTILKGVTLAHHTIVSYGSIVTKSNETPFVVYGGSLNKVLKEGVARPDKYELQESK